MYLYAQLLWYLLNMTSCSVDRSLYCIRPKLSRRTRNQMHEGRTLLSMRDFISYGTKNSHWYFCFMGSPVPLLLRSYSALIDVELARRTFRYHFFQVVLNVLSYLLTPCYRVIATLFRMLGHIATLNQGASKLPI